MPKNKQKTAATKKSTVTRNKRKNRPNVARTPGNGTRTVTAPAAVGRITKAPTTPKMSSTPGGIRVKHRSLFSKIAASATAGNYSSVYGMINPGLPLLSGSPSVDEGCFAWIPNIAKNFQRYKIHALNFKYEPSCGTSTSGLVGMAIVYDSLETLPTSMSQLMMMSGAAAGPLWAEQKISAGSEGLRSQPPVTGRLVRQGAVPSLNSYVDFDLGYFLVATEDCLASQSAGFVWCEVDIEFFLPVTA